jgi:CheY-like chemotaxis protein
MNDKPTIPPARKILVVDDDQVILKTLSMLLNANGYKVLMAGDGPDAVRIFTQNKPDLILLDIQFPPDAMNIGGALQDGFFIMQWLRRMGEGKNIPIIIISGDTSKKARKQALDAGSVAFFPKPIDRLALLAAIRTAFGETPTDAVPATAV